MADSDLSRSIIANVDRHLGNLVLDFLVQRDSSSYDKTSILQAKYQLLKSTNLLHHLEQARKDLEAAGASLNEENSSADNEKDIQELQKKVEELKGNADTVIAVISDPQVAQALGQDRDRNATVLKEKYGLDTASINHLYTYGQYSYSLGDYQAASDYLSSFRILSTDSQLVSSAHWGKLVANILEEDFNPDIALQELKLLKDDIEQNRYSKNPSLLLQQRTAYLHWSLFVFYKIGDANKGMAALVDNWTEATLEPSAVSSSTNSNEKRRTYYLDTIITSCPWLLRYLVTAAVIAHKGPIKLNLTPQQQSLPSNIGKKSLLHPRIAQILRLVEAEKYQYTDAITEFFRLLIGTVDFEGSTRCLKKAQEEILDDDFFMNALNPSIKNLFLNKARHFMSEVYCRIHHKINILDLSKQLNLNDQEQGEQWIVDLIRNTKLDAKIDLSSNIVTMNHSQKSAASIHQNVSDRAKQLLERVQYVLPAPVQQGGQGLDGGRGKNQNRQQQGQQQQQQAQNLPKPVEIKS